MTKIKNFFPEANIIQITTETHEIVIHRSKEGEVFVDVREFATDIEDNLILGKGTLDDGDNDDLDGNPFAKSRKHEMSAPKTCEFCTEPLAYIVPGTQYEVGMWLCQGHADKMNINCAAFDVNRKKDMH